MSLEYTRKRSSFMKLLIIKTQLHVKNNLKILRGDVNLVSFLIALDTVDAKKYN